MSLLAALSLGACVWALARLAFGDAVLPHGLFSGLKLSRGRGPVRAGRPPFQVWLSQAGAAVTTRQFLAASTGLACVVFGALLAVSRTPVVAALPAVSAGAAPYAYWSSERRKHAAARSAAWPDALRYLVGVLGAGLATLHDGLVELSRSGPLPLRAPMARYARLSGRVGDRAALEAVRAELADPISDPVLLAFAGAIEEGTGTVLRVLADLGSQITADLQLAEKIRTLQTQSKAATWGCFALPYTVLFVLCTADGAYRSYFSRPAGLAVVLVGAAVSLAGLAISRRLVRPIATTRRVFAEGGAR
jgi:Flp pilus assembly protein TadB